MSSKELAIVGLDPGNNFGVAILYINGKVKTKLFKNPTEVDVIKWLDENCIPIIIATDVKKIPGIVYKISNFFKCEIYKPRESLSKDYKMKISKVIRGKSVHERDAYAAAYKAWIVYEKRIKKLLKRIEDYKAIILREMIKGKFPSIEIEEIKETRSVNKKSEKAIEKERIKEEIIIIEKKIEKEKPLNKILVQMVELLKEDKVPVIPIWLLEKTSIKEMKEVLRELPVYIPESFLDKFNELKNAILILDPPFIITNNCKLFNDFSNCFNAEDINLKKFGNLYYMDKKIYKKCLAKLIKKKLEKS